MFAASAGQAACVAALIAHADARAALDAQSGQGETALVYACLGVAHASGAAAVGFDECVRLLVAAGADVQLADSRGRCARTACPKHASIVERMAELERDAVASALRLVAEDAPATAKMKKTKAKRNRRPHRRDEPPRGAHASLQPSPSSSEDEAAADEAVAEAVADEAADDDARSIEERRIDEERRIEESRRLKEFLEGRLEAQRLDEERRLDERRLDEERRLEELRLVDEAKRRDEGRSAAVQRPSQKDVDGDSPARQQHVPASPAPASLEVRAASPEAASPEASDEVEASEAQRLLELLHPAASALALKVEHLLCATPLQSSSQLEALHSILDVCLRRVIEARIVNAVDHEREMLRSLARGPPTAKDPVDP
ncbi:hypothetical protein M885DRAFT_517413 [Pelagophyceae sp. CCMP2097]|nr:hypothetical protein M885DRAFT_517413 [Pelagophyceae sp. CCMP2097]